MCRRVVRKMFSRTDKKWQYSRLEYGPDLSTFLFQSESNVSYYETVEPDCEGSPTCIFYFAFGELKRPGPKNCFIIRTNMYSMPIEAILN